MGKAKPASHTSKELAAKAKAALTNKGGGQSGKVDRWEQCFCGAGLRPDQMLEMFCLPLCLSQF